MSISSECRAVLVRHLPRLVVLHLAMLASVTASAQSREQLAGIWRIEKSVFAVRTVDGREPPLKEEAAKVYRQHVAMRKQGDTSFDSATWCAAVGMPRLLFIDSPIKIMVNEPYVAFVHEWNWWARVVYLEGALTTKPASAPTSGAAPPAPPPGPPGMKPPGGAPPGGPGFGPPGMGPPGFGASDASSEQPGPMGFSKGHWEGDTLVIETTQLLDTTLIDGAGIPHSDALKLTERVRLRSPDVLEDRIRIEDPATFTQPWETVVTYKRQPRGTQLQEDVCLDRIKTGAPAVKE